jgi:hypothetical protein
MRIAAELLYPKMREAKGKTHWLADGYSEQTYKELVLCTENGCGDMDG